MKIFKYLAILGLLVLTVLVGSQYAAQPVAAETGNTVQPLPTVGTYENLKKILLEAQQAAAYHGAPMREALAMDSAAGAPAARSDAQNFSSAKNEAEYSQTNVQVQGVDEADSVKSDGTHIYKITGNKIVIAAAYPATEMKVVSTLDFSHDLNPVEMYVDGKQLVVILNSYNPVALEKELRSAAGADGSSGVMPLLWPFENSVKVQVYDLSDKANPQKVREVEIDGAYISSRKIGHNVYLASNRYIAYHILRQPGQELPAPAYRDSAAGDEIKQIGYEQICYFPGSAQPNYLIIAAINLDTLKNEETEVKTYLGSGQNIYASADNLFVAVAEYQYDQVQPLDTDDVPRILPAPAVDVAPDMAPGVWEQAMPAIWPVAREINTSFYKFSLKDGKTNYAGKGTVPGNILNQFSMDETNGYFRVATTTEKYTLNKMEMSNNLYVLDADMNTVGKIENIAPDERIYSVRFLGDRGYMVTFKTVDPLYVLDLKTPDNPKILGELKIPGYSNYLHPYDENHIIGFGKEAVEIEEPHWSGQGTVKNAYYLGMKIALFDVSDVGNPKEKFKIEIGDRGTESELFWNHKALLFSKEKNLMAFPVTVNEIQPDLIDKYDFAARRDPRLAYGMPVFQGAMVYSVSAAEGFKLKGTITHQPPGELYNLQKTQKYDYNSEISRILYINDMLYTVSNNYLQANELSTLEEKAAIALGNP